MTFLPSLLTALLVSPFADGFVNPQRPLISRDLTRVNAASFGSSNSFDDHKKPSKAKGEKNARTFNEIGLVAEKAGLYAEAAAAYKRAIVEEPWNPVAHGNLGNALSELGLEALQECIDEYHTAVMLALARPDKNLKKSNARLASEYLVNLALTLLHVPSTVKRHHPRVAAEPDRVDEALAALKHAMHLCPKDAAIKFMFVVVGSVLVGVVEDTRMISIGLKGLGYEDSLKELELELETVPQRSSRA